MKELLEIQKKLKCTKDKRNSFGNYNYRTCSAILEAFKALETNCELLMFDEVVEAGGRVFVKATAMLSNQSGDSVSADAYAETGPMGGMSTPQTTGAASTYARKYALCGLFAIDDSTDDPEAQKPEAAKAKNNTNSKSIPTPAAKRPLQNGNEMGLVEWCLKNHKNLEFVKDTYELTDEQLLIISSHIN